MSDRNVNSPAQTQPRPQVRDYHRYSPGSTFVVKETTGPVTYRYGETITYVTRTGQPLSEEQVRTIKVGTPVNVHYVTEGDARILNRVEVDEIEVDDDGEIEIDD